MNIPAQDAWPARRPVPQCLRLFLSLLPLILYLSGPLSAAGLHREPRACALFVYRGVINHSASRGRGSSTSRDSLPSFFERFRKGSKKSEQGPQQVSQFQTEVDLYRLLGIQRDAPSSAIAARVDELQKQQHEQFSGVGTPQLDPLVASLLHEVSETLQNSEQRAAYDEGGYVPEPLYALLQQLLPALPSSTSQKERQDAAETVDQEEEPEVEKTAGGPSNLFSAIFGPHFLGNNSPFAAVKGRRRTSRPQRGVDVESAVTLGFVDAALRGASSLPVIVQRQEPCDACSSWDDSRKLKASACKVCEGRGMQTEVS